MGIDTDTNYGIMDIYIILSTDTLPIPFKSQNYSDIYFILFYFTNSKDI